ncbi:MAG: Fe-S cluster assembly ATPase SufC [Candidatus Helarchaeota archaeon]
MVEYLLEIHNLAVQVERHLILKNINLSIPKSESYVLFGPNGSGKSTLIKAIVGFPNYKITKGKIVFDGHDITNLPISQRMQLGISMAYQHPPEIKGIKLIDLFKFCLKKKLDEDLDPEHYALIEKLKMTSFLNRNINVGFSGGERKRSEIIQMLLLRPKLLLLDEPDSGVDIESLKLISKEIQNYITQTSASVLIVTHQGEILNYITTKRACVLLDSSIYCYKNSQDIFNTIKDVGFAKCIECQERGEETNA